MSICLNMIVRDESSNLERLFNSLRGVIDYYVILDTGSTDDTIEKIATLGADLKISGVVDSAEWTGNFGEMRQQALDLAYLKSPCSHILILDADEEFERQMMTTLPSWGYLLNTLSNYRIPKYYGRLRNDHINLISQAGAKATWSGTLHEVLYVPETEKVERFHWGRIRSHANEGCRGRGMSVEEKLWKDVGVLVKELQKEKKSRTSFYLAQTYRELGIIGYALDHYTDCLETATGEMRYRAALGVALCKETLFSKTGAPSKEDSIERAYVQAINCRPDRLESYYYLSRYYYKNAKINLSYIYAKAGLSYMATADSYMIESDIYEWRMLAMYCRICLRLGKTREMEEVYETLMDSVTPTHNTLEFANEKLSLVNMRRSFGEPIRGE